jgi:uncharacterized membrane protein
MFRYGPGFHHDPSVFGWFILALLVALLVLGIVALVRLWNHPHGRLGPWHAGPHMMPPTGPHMMPPTAPPVDPALTELRVRYARGDISWEEFSRRAANLGYSQPEAGPGMPPHQV